MTLEPCVRVQIRLELALALRGKKIVAEIKLKLIKSIRHIINDILVQLEICIGTTIPRSMEKQQI
jgi:hypothetical protein